MTPDEIKTLAAELRQTMHELDRQTQKQEYDEWEEGQYRVHSTRVRGLQREISDLEEKGRTITKELSAAVKRHEVLAPVIEFLDGKIVYAVRQDGAPMITQGAEMFSYRDGYSRKPMLLSLRPNLMQTKRGSMRGDDIGQWEISGWLLNTWGDGSGSDMRVIPCRSLEEAHDHVRRLFAADVEQWRKQLAGDVKREHMNHSLMNLNYWKKYQESGVELDWPADLTEHYNQSARRRHGDRLAALRGELEELKETTPDLPFPAYQGRADA